MDFDLILQLIFNTHELIKILFLPFIENANYAACPHGQQFLIWQRYYQSVRHYNDTLQLNRPKDYTEVL